LLDPWPHAAPSEGVGQPAVAWVLTHGRAPGRTKTWVKTHATLARSPHGAQRNAGPCRGACMRHGTQPRIRLRYMRATLAKLASLLKPRP
jgi:hypothetical protein